MPTTYKAIATIKNPDKKLDKVTNSTTNQVYGVKSDGTQRMYPVSSQSRDAGDIVLTTFDGNICVPDETPEEDYYAVSYGVVSSMVSGKLDKDTSTEASGQYRLYAIAPNGEQVIQRYTTAVGSYLIVNRDGNGQVLLPETPTASNHAASKSFVETACGYRVAQVNNESGLDKAYIRDASNTETTMTIDKSATANTIVKRDSGGNVYTATPTDNAHATNKGYVDGKSKAISLTSGTDYSVSIVSNAQVREFIQEAPEGYLVNLFINFYVTPSSVTTGQSLFDFTNAPSSFKLPDSNQVILMDNATSSQRNVTCRVSGKQLLVESTNAAQQWLNLNYTFIVMK